ncbi:hypothetical protein NHX12_014589, partial [Muraenolepis orangiensis]
MAGGRISLFASQFSSPVSLGVSEELQACASDSAVEEEHEQPAEDDREPASDHNYYAHNSAGVVDAAAAETIRQLEAKISETFSPYKNTNTFKGLIGIAP